MKFLTGCGLVDLLGGSLNWNCGRWNIGGSGSCVDSLSGSLSWNTGGCVSLGGGRWDISGRCGSLLCDGGRLIGLSRRRWDISSCGGGFSLSRCCVGISCSLLWDCGGLIGLSSRWNISSRRCDLNLSGSLICWSSGGCIGLSGGAWDISCRSRSLLWDRGGLIGSSCGLSLSGCSVGLSCSLIGSSCGRRWNISGGGCVDSLSGSLSWDSGGLISLGSRSIVSSGLSHWSNISISRRLVTGSTSLIISRRILALWHVLSVVTDDTSLVEREFSRTLHWDGTSVGAGDVVVAALSIWRSGGLNWDWNVVSWSGSGLNVDWSVVWSSGSLHIGSWGSCDVYWSIWTSSGLNWNRDIFGWSRGGFSGDWCVVWGGCWLSDVFSWSGGGLSDVWGSGGLNWSIWTSSGLNWNRDIFGRSRGGFSGDWCVVWSGCWLSDVFSWSGGGLNIAWSIIWDCRGLHILGWGRSWLGDRLVWASGSLDWNWHVLSWHGGGLSDDTNVWVGGGLNWNIWVDWSSHVSSWSRRGFRRRTVGRCVVLWNSSALWNVVRVLTSDDSVVVDQLKFTSRTSQKLWRASTDRIETIFLRRTVRVHENRRVGAGSVTRSFWSCALEWKVLVHTSDTILGTDRGDEESGEDHTFGKHPGKILGEMDGISERKRRILY
ncbi:hypothetical protein GCK72_002970 [Caenorhabditis remanei]|uniref:Uncharacterized protein n=1 Tax=Caenorhabditis remanei TaxID=31234 RepID=A0A6A5HWG5_CAERE|nr:hypothetical protein GCK72_002970 [Caenorhabditis remanei]KAF1771144.1 hypothetical protein GCK72_002970 [Caenorhabditis remanei]